MKFTLRPSTPNDLPALMHIVADAQAYLRQLGIDQWQDGYPSEAQIAQDIASGDGYVMVSDSQAIAGMVYLTTAGEPTYDSLFDGQWPTPLSVPFGCIHRLAVSNAFRGQGAARYTILACEDQLMAQGITNLKIDTHPDNKGMQRLIGSLGYAYCGKIYLDNGDLRLAYEKTLKK